MAFVLATLLINLGPNKPRTLIKALNFPQWSKQQKVILDKYCFFFVNKIQEVIPKRPLLYIFIGKWVYKIKKNKCGEVIYYKVCYIVQGFKQIKGLDYNKSFIFIICL